MLRLIGVAAASLAVSSCSAVGPDFMRPSMEVADRFAFAPQDALLPAAQHAWWQSLGDPALAALMDDAMRQNLDIEAARARILRSEALLRAEGLHSNLSGDVSLSQDYTSVEGDPFEQTNSGTFAPSFIIDLFGGSRRSREAASRDLAAAVYDRGSAKLAVQLSVAQAYFQLRFFETALDIRRDDIRNKQRLVRITRDRAELQDATAVDLNRSEAELATARTRLPSLIAGRRVALVSLATLLAEPVGRLESRIGGTRRQPVPQAHPDPGLPAALLANRPDIRAAEARLASAVAVIGIRQAELYPSLRINGQLRASAVDTVRIGPSLSLPVLNRRVLAARRDAARAQALEAEILWRSTVLDAVDEVQRALVRNQQFGEEARLLKSALARYNTANALSREAFDLAAITLQEVFETEDDRTQVELQLAAARRDLAQSWAELNVAIGQGWSAESVSAPDGIAVASR